MYKKPLKKVYSKENVDAIRNLAIKKIKKLFLPDEKIIKIILIGSSVKNNFGEYEPPGFRGSLYSDLDFIIFVEDDYEIPGWLCREPTGKPFADDALNLAYRNKNFIGGKYDVEVFFVRRSSMRIKDIQMEGERAGIPMTSTSEHEHILVFAKEQ
jgi:hypothetical protein